MNLRGLIVQPVLVFSKIPPALEHNDSLFAFSRLQSILADLAMPSLFCIKPSHNDFGFMILTMAFRVSVYWACIFWFYLC